MNHIDSKLLVNYNPLIDPHLRSYFSHERVQSHLRHAGLINRRGEIISDGEYRRRLTRREHKKHVRHVLAENIVHRAIDMERARQAELRHRLDMVTKAALVHNVKEARRYPGGSSSANISKSDDMGASWFKVRPKSTSQHRDVQLMTEEYDGQSRILRVQSANVNDDLQRKHPLKSSTFHHHHRPPTESKRSAAHRSSSLHHPRPITKSSESSLSNSPCRITMIYYGTNIKREHDHPIFESVDEVLVMQQHCGGENLIVYRANLKPGDEFTFNSRRHAEYPLGLSLYIKGLIDSRISTCCEYKHRHGVRLGGERGHFAIVSVEGSKPCLKCRFEKQIQSKELSETAEEEEEKKPITISIAVSDEPKRKQTPVKIPVRHTPPPPASEENYSEDFDDSDKGEKMNKHQPASKSNSKQTKFQDTPVKTHVPPKTSSTKIWQIIFHSSNIPTGSFQLPKKASVDVSLKLSLLSSNGQNESEQYEINMRDYPHYFKSGRQDLFRAKLQDIDQLKQIRLLLEINDDHHEEIKWHLDHIEIIDPDTRIHYRFLCNQWIRPSEEKLLNLTESFNEKKSSYKQKPAIRPTPQSSTDDDEQKKIPYRVVIHPAKDHHGEFNASNDSRIFLRVNDQNKDSFLYKNQTKSCPSFEPGEHQTFPIDLIQKPTKLTIGYYNTDITAGKWKLQKIVLINTKTNEETVFPCRESLIRNELNSRAEKTFQAQSKLSDDDHHSDENRMFEKKDSVNKQEFDSRPKTRRGRQDTLENEQPSNKSQPTSDIWRPSSDSEPVDLSRSTDQKKRQVLSINSD